jgi:hypothetical protein
MHSAVQSFRGIVTQFNLSPKGSPEGLLLQVDGGGDSPIQVNFDPALAGGVSRAVQVGQTVTVEVAPFRDAHPDGLPVFDLHALSIDGGATFTAQGPGEADVTVRGTVVGINHARRGEPNGAILDTGDFVHLRPHGARAVGLRIGQQLEAAGEVRPGWSGHRVIEARTANGVDIEKPAKPGHAKPPKHGPHGRHPAPPLARAKH